MTDVPPIRFAEARGARLAYQVWGDGPTTIVAIPPLAQNIEVAWEWPTIRRMFDRFGSFSRFLHFDKRGTGSSDRRSRVPGVDERVDDIRAVMDAAGIESGHFFVQSDGGPMALLFAATYPDRVESLVLVGSFAAREFDGPPEEYVERRNRAAAEWGTPDIELADWFLIDPSSHDGLRDRRIGGTLESEQIVDVVAVLMKSRAFSKVTMALGLEPEAMDVTEVPG